MTKPRVLLTGFSARECGDTKREALFWDMIRPVQDALNQIVDVDRRRVSLGEDLAEYEAAVVVLNQALSFNTRHGVLGSLWTLSRDLPCLIYLSDWQHRSMLSHLRTILKHPHYLNKTVAGERLFFTEDSETTTNHAEELLGAAESLTSGWPGRWLGLAPLFDWGDPRRFSDAFPAGTVIRGADFSPYAMDTFPDLADPPGDPDRSWLCATLSPQARWAEKQGLTWPVQHLGSRKLKVPRVKEREVVEEMAKHWGTLSPAYYHAGSGWWRLRFCWSALTKRVLGCDPAEAGVLGSYFQLKPSEVEGLTDSELRQHALGQAHALEARMWPRERADHAIHDALREVWRNHSVS